MYIVMLKNGQGLSRVVKEYPYRLQALMYCWLHGYVNVGRGRYWLDTDRVQIIRKV